MTLDQILKPYHSAMTITLMMIDSGLYLNRAARIKSHEYLKEREK